MEHTKVLLHDHNEYLNEKVFLRGIQWYEKTIMALANVASEAEKQAGKLLIQA